VLIVGTRKTKEGCEGVEFVFGFPHPGVHGWVDLVILVALGRVTRGEREGGREGGRVT